MAEILTFAWALLLRSYLIVAGALIVLFVAYRERQLHSEPRWEVYGRLLLASFAAAALLAGRDVSQEFARSGKHFSDAGPLKSVIASPLGRFTIDSATARRIEVHVPDAAGQPAERDPGRAISTAFDADAFRRPDIDARTPAGPPASVEAPRQEPDSTTGSGFNPLTALSGLQLTEGLRADIRAVHSPRDDMPYALELTVKVTDIIQPFGVVLTGDGVIDDLDFQVLGEAVYMMVLQGHIKDRPDQYYVGFDSPAVGPQKPVVITVRARRPIRISRIERAYIPHG